MAQDFRIFREAGLTLTLVTGRTWPVNNLLAENTWP
jgi:hypothetical protein